MPCRLYGKPSLLLLSLAFEKIAPTLYKWNLLCLWTNSWGYEIIYLKLQNSKERNCFSFPEKLPIQNTSFDDKLIMFSQMHLFGSVQSCNGCKSITILLVSTILWKCSFPIKVITCFLGPDHSRWHTWISGPNFIRSDNSEFIFHPRVQFDSHGRFHVPTDGFWNCEQQGDLVTHSNGIIHSFPQLLN